MGIATLQRRLQIRKPSNSVCREWVLCMAPTRGPRTVQNGSNHPLGPSKDLRDLSFAPYPSFISLEEGTVYPKCILLQQKELWKCRFSCLQWRTVGCCFDLLGLESDAS